MRFTLQASAKVDYVVQGGGATIERTKAKFLMCKGWFPSKRILQQNCQGILQACFE